MGELQFAHPGIGVVIFQGPGVCAAKIWGNAPTTRTDTAGFEEKIASLYANSKTLSR
jgi:hypothetical protein